MGKNDYDAFLQRFNLTGRMCKILALCVVIAMLAILALWLFVIELHPLGNAFAKFGFNVATFGVILYLFVWYVRLLTASRELA